MVTQVWSHGWLNAPRYSSTGVLVSEMLKLFLG